MPVARKITLKYIEYSKNEKLLSEDQELIDSARDAALRAYAPYSGFRVGAAVRLGSGRIITGSNVENAAFPSGICAERTALAYAVANWPEDMAEVIAIAAVNSSRIPAESVSPCGFCRQVIAEEELRKGGKIRILLSCREKTIVVDSIRDLLPLQFSKLNLEDHSSPITS